jgi:uncharacterized repeat protein (TIGR01451 family)
MSNLEPAAFASSRQGCAGFSLLPCHKRRFTYASALLFWLSLIIISPPSASALSKPSFPVIFIHGIASDAGAWSAFGVFLTENGWISGGFPTYNRTTGQVAGVTPGDFYTLNFSNNQQLHFDEQGFELEAIIQAVLNANTGETKVVLIGHSMGGLAAREYMQGLARFNQTSPRINYKGDVAQLITVGTPHAGAGLANILSLFPDFIDAFGIDPDSAAVEDLRPDSAAFIVLNDLLANPLPTNVPLASIVGAGTNVIGTFIDGDGIVSVSSQNLGGLDGASGLSHESKTVFILDRADCDPGFGNALPNETHTCETTDQSVWSELLRELRPSVGNAPLTLSMTASPDPVRPAEFIAYAYTVSNRGTTDLSGVELSTLVPDHTSVDPFSITGGGGGCGVICSPGEEVLWSLGTLFAGQSRTVQMAARVDPQPFVGPAAPPDGTLITNSAQVTDSSGDTAVTVRSVVVGAMPVLTLGIADDREPVEPGGLLTYTLTFGNRGTVNAPGVQLSTTVPAGTIFVSASDGGSETGGVVGWSLGTVSVGESGQRQLIVEVDAGATDGSVLFSEAEIRDTNSVENNARASATTVVQSTANAPLTLSMTASPDPVRPAEFIAYAYTVSNRGTTDLSGVELSTLVPDHTSVDPFSITGSGGGCGVICSPGEEVLWSLGTLFAGQSRTVQMAARVDPQPFVGSTAPPDGTLITNSAQVFHPGEGYTATDNTETRVCAGDGTECIHVVTPPLTFTDDPLTLQVTPINAVHITELREAINTLRSNNGLEAFSFTDSALTAGVTQVRAVHLTDWSHTGSCGASHRLKNGSGWGL